MGPTFDTPTFYEAFLRYQGMITMKMDALSRIEANNTMEEDNINYLQLINFNQIKLIILKF